MSIKDAPNVATGQCPPGRFRGLCGRALLITASYQVFSLCLPSGGSDLLASSGPQAPSLFTVPSFAHVPQINECRCVGGCIGCTGLSKTGTRTAPSSAASNALSPLQVKARASNEQGIAASNKGDWDTAILKFAEASQLWPDNPVYTHNLATAKNEKAVAAYNASQWDDAVKWFGEAVELDSTDPVFKRNLNAAQDEASDAARRRAEQADTQRRETELTSKVRQVLSAIGTSPNLDLLGAKPNQAGGLDFMPSAPVPAASTRPAPNTDPAVVDLSGATRSSVNPDAVRGTKPTPPSPPPAGLDFLPAAPVSPPTGSTPTPTPTLLVARSAVVLDELSGLENAYAHARVPAERLVSSNLLRWVMVEAGTSLGTGSSDRLQSLYGLATAELRRRGELPGADEIDALLMQKKPAGATRDWPGALRAEPPLPNPLTIRTTPDKIDATLERLRAVFKGDPFMEALLAK